MKQRILNYVIGGLMVIGLLVFMFAWDTQKVEGAIVQTGSIDRVYGNTYLLTMTCTTDSGVSTFTTASSDQNIDGYVFLVTTDPDSGTNPTANYDIVLNDTEGVDIMGGELANRSATAEEQAVPLIDAVYGARFVDGPLEVAISGNSVNDAVIILRIWFYRSK